MSKQSSFAASAVDGQTFTYRITGQVTRGRILPLLLRICPEQPPLPPQARRKTYPLLAPKYHHLQFQQYVGSQQVTTRRPTFCAKTRRGTPPSKRATVWPATLTCPKARPFWTTSGFWGICSATRTSSSSSSMKTKTTWLFWKRALLSRHSRLWGLCATTGIAATINHEGGGGRKKHHHHHQQRRRRRPNE